MTDLIERAKVALEKYDANHTHRHHLAEISPDLARALIREREAADRLAEACEIAFSGIDATGPQEFYLALDAYRKAQKETDDG